MKELNLEVGQKCWSIQIGDCEVCFKDDKTITCTNGNIEKEYYLNGKMFHHDHYQSLFESNPFEQKLVQESESKENKAELIKVLRDISIIHKDHLGSKITDLAKTKLQKLLESL